MPAFQQFATGQVAVLTTATQLPEIPANPVAGEGFAIRLEALAANTASVFYGPAGVTTSTGAELAPGASVILYLNNADLIFVIAAATGSKVTWSLTEFY